MYSSSGQSEEKVAREARVELERDLRLAGGSFSHAARLLAGSQGEKKVPILVEECKEMVYQKDRRLYRLVGQIGV